MNVCRMKPQSNEVLPYHGDDPVVWAAVFNGSFSAGAAIGINN
jgi:hypothetical protein